MSWFFVTLETIMVLLLISITLVLSFNSLHVFAASSKQEILQLPQQQQFIQTCCAWGDKIADGILTYTINGAGNAAAQQAVNNAIEEWNTKINGIKLVEISDSNSADIQINLNSKAPKLQTSVSNNNHGPIKAAGKDIRLLAPGLSEINRDNNGFIDQVTVNIATAASGKTSSFNPSEIEAVTKHELGHALGLGHADFITDLMSPILTGNTRPTISQCDVNGVIQANSWKMTYSNNSLSSPPVNHVDC